MTADVVPIWATWFHLVMLTLTSVQAFRELAGTELGTSKWHVVTQQRVNDFADATDDHTAIHIDPDRAMAAGLDGTIAHGLYTLSLGPKFLHEIYSLSGYSVALNYGFERVRFLSPVATGSRVRMKAVLDGAEPIAGGTKFTIAETFELEGSSKPACVAEAVVAYFD